MKDKFGWSHSKVGEYESPPLDEISRWKLEEQYGTNVWSGQFEKVQREKGQRSIWRALR